MNTDLIKQLLKKLQQLVGLNQTIQRHLADFGDCSSEDVADRQRLQTEIANLKEQIELASDSQLEIDYQTGSVTVIHF